MSGIGGANRGAAPFFHERIRAEKHRLRHDSGLGVFDGRSTHAHKAVINLNPDILYVIS